MASHHGKLFDLLAGHILETSRLKPVLDFLMQAESGAVATLVASDPAQVRARATPLLEGPRPRHLDDLILAHLKTHGGSITVEEGRRIAVAAGYSPKTIGGALHVLAKAGQLERVGRAQYALAKTNGAAAAAKKTQHAAGKKKLKKSYKFVGSDPVIKKLKKKLEKRQRQDRTHDGRSRLDVARDYVKTVPAEIEFSTAKLAEVLESEGFSGASSGIQFVTKRLVGEGVLRQGAMRGRWLARGAQARE